MFFVTLLRYIFPVTVLVLRQVRFDLMAFHVISFRLASHLVLNVSRLTVLTVRRVVVVLGSRHAFRRVCLEQTQKLTGSFHLHRAFAGNLAWPHAGFIIIQRAFLNRERRGLMICRPTLLAAALPVAIHVAFFGFLRHCRRHVLLAVCEMF